MVLALAGDYGVGKSTLAKNLDGYKVLSFGNYVRDELIKTIGIEKEVVYQKPTPDYVRNLLKGYGDWRRNADSGYWSRKLIQDLFSSDHPVVIDDIRFKQEYYDLLRTFMPVTLVYIGKKVDTYENEFLYEMANFRLPKHPKFFRMSNKENKIS